MTEFDYRAARDCIYGIKRVDGKFAGFERRDLSPAEVSVLMALVEFAPSICPSIGSIEQMTQLSNRTIKRTLLKCERRSILRIYRKRGARNCYELMLDAIQPRSTDAGLLAQSGAKSGATLAPAGSGPPQSGATVASVPPKSGATLAPAGSGPPQSGATVASVPPKSGATLAPAGSGPPQSGATVASVPPKSGATLTPATGATSQSGATVSPQPGPPWHDHRGHHGPQSRQVKQTKEAKRESTTTEQKARTLSDDSNPEVDVMRRPSNQLALPVQIPTQEPQSRETELPDTWEPTDEHREFAERYGIDIHAAVFGFRGHYDGGVKARSWNGRFATWLSNCVRYRAQGGLKQYSPQRGIADGLELGDPSVFDPDSPQTDLPLAAVES